MAREEYLREIEKRITDSEKGSIFITSDFFDLTNTDAVNKALSRLAEGGVIRRIMRGIYELPEYSEFLQENISPSPDKIAKALARNFGWTITPCGDTALNILGVSTQVPSVWSYVSNGDYRTYRYDRVTLLFKHTANKEISTVSYKTALVIQALKALGHVRMDTQIFKKISSALSKSEKQEMLTEAKHTTAWIYEAIKHICIEDFR